MAGGVGAPSWLRGAFAVVAESAAVRWLLALVTLVAGWYLGKVFIRVFGRRIARRFQRPSLTRTVLRGMRTGAFVLSTFVAASILGFRIGDIVLSVTVFSAVLGLVLAPIVGSVVNGLFVLADQPYEIGDLVELADSGRRGFVEDITLRYTKVFTLDNTFLVIPNSSIRERDIVNYSAEDERTRLSLRTTVTYEGDLDAARRLMESAARDVEEVIDGGPDIRIGSARYPAAPTCYIDEYGDHGVALTLRYWARQPYKLLTVRSKVQERAWTALEASDEVEIAYPHSHLVFDETSGEARVAVTDEGGSGPDSRAPPRRSGTERRGGRSGRRVREEVADRHARSGGRGAGRGPDRPG
jgi:small-conductance mechanosensitive channel